MVIETNKQSAKTLIKQKEYVFTRPK